MLVGFGRVRELCLHRYMDRCFEKNSISQSRRPSTCLLWGLTNLNHTTTFNLSRILSAASEAGSFPVDIDQILDVSAWQQAINAKANSSTQNYELNDFGLATPNSWIHTQSIISTFSSAVPMTVLSPPPSSPPVFPAASKRRLRSRASWRCINMISGKATRPTLRNDLPVLLQSRQITPQR